MTKPSSGTRPFRVSCPTCGTTWPTARSYYLDMTLWELVAKTGKAPNRRAPRGFWPLLVRSWNQATGRHDNAQAMRSRYSRLRKEWTRHNTITRLLNNRSRLLCTPCVHTPPFRQKYYRRTLHESFCNNCPLDCTVCTLSLRSPQRPWPRPVPARIPRHWPPTQRLATQF